MADNLSRLDGQQVLRRVHDQDENALKIVDLAALIPKQYDHITLTYVASGNGAGELETATYRTGGQTGTVVGTITLTYDASDRAETISVTLP